MMAVDEELGYVYLPVSTPTNDFYGGHRLGDNLFAESIVCLDADTGERVADNGEPAEDAGLDLSDEQLAALAARETTSRLVAFALP